MMKAMGPLVLFVIAAFLSPTAAPASELSEKKKQLEQEEDLAASVETMNKACETKITAGSDWKSFKMADLETYSGSTFCGIAISGLVEICNDVDGKEAVQKQVKNVTCKYGKKRQLTLKKGLLEFTIDWQASNNQVFVREMLNKSL